MKPIKDYFKDKDLRVEYLDGYAVHINRELLLEVIKEIQIDTIRETAQACADNAKILFHDGFWKEDKRMEYFQSGENNLQISKDSILEVADKLIKKLE
jgi:hypothetical protein